MKVANLHMHLPAMELAVAVQSSMTDILMLSLCDTLDKGESLRLRYGLGIWIYLDPDTFVGKDLQSKVAVAWSGGSPVEEGSG